MNLLYPVFALVTLTLLVLIRLAALRWAAASQGEISLRYYEAYIGDEPPKLRVVSRHLINLLETPVLFYVACLVGVVTQQTGLLLLALAWAYVALRLVHTLIHLGSNIVTWRFRVFGLSILTLALMWAALFIGLISR